MKKAYRKPDLYFESFELSTSIAAGCSVVSNHAEQVCPVEIPGWGGETYFAQGMCTYTPAPGDNKICYHVPSAGENVFTS